VSRPHCSARTRSAKFAALPGDGLDPVPGLPAEKRTPVRLGPGARHTTPAHKTPECSGRAVRANSPGTGAGGNPAGPRRTGVSAARPSDSLDEVAGSLLREALLPAAGQVCGNARKVRSNSGRRGAPPPERPARGPSTHLSGSCGPS
jgi:hypothetical protein